MPAGAQIVHHALHFGEQLPGSVLGARLRQILDLVHHPFQVTLTQHSCHFVLAKRILRHRVLQRFLGKLAHELVHRLPQLLHQPVDFLVARAILKRITQPFLCLAQPALGFRQIPELDSKGNLPHEIKRIAQPVIVPGVDDAAPDHRKSGDGGSAVDEFVRCGEYRVQHVGDMLRLARIECQYPPLLDDRASKRIGELPTGQGHLVGSALARLAGVVSGEKGNLHFASRPGVLGEVAIGLRRTLLGAVARQRQGQMRRLHQRPGLRIALDHRLEPRLGLHDAVIILDLVVELQRA